MTDYFKPDTDDIVSAISQPAVMDALSGKTILLTGAAGFLGRWLVRTFAALNKNGMHRPCRMIMVDAVGTAGHELEAEDERLRFEFVHHDLADGQRMDFGERLDLIIHAAGIASPFWYRKNPLGTIDVAVNGSRQCLELARKNPGCRYLFTSSSEVYQTPTDEHIPTQETYVGAIPTRGPRSCYDISKALGETLSHVYYEQHGVHTTLVRIFNSFGCGMSERDHRILPRIGSAMKTGRPMDIYFDPTGRAPSRTYCPVSNTVVGIILALVHGEPDEVYNIGASTPELTTQALLSRVTAVSGRRVPFEEIRQSGVYSGEPMRRCPDITKAQRELGYQAVVPFETGLGRFIEWALATYTDDGPMEAE